MSLSSSLSAGVSGLMTNATRLATISDNIANSSTIGYRRADVEFSSLVNAQTTSSFPAGGVRGFVHRDIASAGSLTSTGNATDLAVGGNGMLPVTETDRVDLPREQQPFLFTPTGSFEPNEDGYLTTRTGLTLLGLPFDRNGQLPENPVRDGPDSLEPVQVTPFINAAQQTSEIALGVNLPAGETEAGANFPNNTFESPIQYFDSVGRAETLTVVYVPTDPGAGNPPSNAWTIQIFDSGTPGNADPAADPPLSEIVVTFDDENGGQIADPAVTPVAGANAGDYDPNTGLLQIDARNGEVPIEVFVGSGDPNVQGGLSQLDAEFAPTNVTKNGAPAGTLSGLEVDEKGVLSGVYDTGQRVPLFQIPIADFPNMNGLTALDNQAFAGSPDSGQVFLHDAATGPVGSLESFALQESSVDVAEELTNLIQTQRAYSSNASVIRTVDEMLQETTNLKR
jgi:flagellar hook protein FlgE